MTDIRDVPYGDIKEFLLANNKNFKNKDDAYDQALILLKDKKAIGHTTSIIEWLTAHNLFVRKVNIPNYTIYKIDNMSQNEINQLAKLLTMNGNNPENILNILRYLHRLNDITLVDDINKPNYKTLTQEEIEELFRNRFKNKGKNENVDNEPLAKYYEVKYIDLPKILKILKNIQPTTDLTNDVVKFLNDIADKIYKDLISSDNYSFISYII
jgi:predicted transcriptional regulator